MKQIFGLVLFSLFLQTFAVTSPVLSDAAGDAEKALSGVEADFHTFVGSVDQTTKELDIVIIKLSTSEKVAMNVLSLLDKGDPRWAKLQKALQKIRRIREAAKKYNGGLKLFSKSAGHVGSAFDLYDKVIDIRDRAAGRRGGPLAGQLSVLADVMAEYGGKIPLLGEALSDLGTITGGMLNATDKLAVKMAEIHKQGIIGVGTGQNLDDPRYIKLVQQVPGGNTLTLVPATSNFVFENLQTSDKRDFIWDAARQKWYVVKGNLRAPAIFAEGLLAGKRFAPSQLEHLTRNSASIIRRKANARHFLGLMNAQHAGLNYGRTISDIDDKYGRNVYYNGKNPAYFLARYAFDGKYQNEVHIYAAVMWAHALTSRNGGELVRKLEKLAQDTGVDLYAVLPEEEKVALLERQKRLKAKIARKPPGISHHRIRTSRPVRQHTETAGRRINRSCEIWATRKKCLMRKRVCVKSKTVKKCNRYDGTNFYTRKCISWDSYPLCVEKKNKCVEYKSYRYCKKRR